MEIKICFYKKKKFKLYVCSPLRYERIFIALWRDARELGKAPTVFLIKTWFKKKKKKEQNRITLV